ncbi:MAG TPA: methylmalonyl-CoA mutase family protein, partial [Myxococcales bacterium]|nr:methylmalonyl-CoA mutase family protein [Myxococcales bacterium]
MPRTTKRRTQLSARTANRAAAKPSVRKNVARAPSRQAQAPGGKLYDAAALRKIAREVEQWRAEDVQRTVQKQPLRKKDFTTDSGIPIPDLLTAADRRQEAFEALGVPGRYPFTRGVQPTMYRGRLWTMRQFAGFGTPEDTNRRF